MDDKQCQKTRREWWAVALAGLGLLAVVQGARAESLNLNQYLDQVKRDNRSFRAVSQKKQGFAESRRQADLVFSPRLEGDGHNVRDASYPNSPGFGYSQIRSQGYSLGISQQFSFGVQAKLKYQVSRVEYVDASFGGTPIAFQNWNATPKAEVTVPLWQNLFGRSSRANQESIASQNDLETEAANSKQIEILVNAQSAYWRLISAREIVRIQQEAFARSETLLKFVEGKAKLDLREKSDVLQTRASYSAAQLDLKAALDEERGAAREFNRWRGQESDTGIPALEKLSFEMVSKQNLPTARPGDRVDVRVARAELSLTKASAVISEEANKPELALVGSYTLNGRNDNNLNSAMTDTTRSGRPSYSYGVQLSMPLNFGAADDARSGARMRQSAAESEVEHRMFDQEQEWRDLSEKFKDAKERVRISEVIVKAQNDKLSEERRLLRLGRSSLFNVLNFEQDYLRAERSRVQSAFDVLVLKIQSQLFVGRDL